MKDTKKEFKPFLIAGYTLEKYLDRMHAEGWAFYKYTGPGFFHFVRCTPEEVRYQTDFNPEAAEDRAQYVQMYQDCGWSHVFQGGAVYIFRKPVRDMQGDERVFCDDESRMEAMGRFFRGRLLVMVLLFVACVVPQLIMSALRPVDGWFSIAVSVALFFVVFLFLVYFVIFGAVYFQFKKRVRRGKSGL